MSISPSTAPRSVPLPRGVGPADNGRAFRQVRIRGALVADLGTGPAVSVREHVGSSTPSLPHERHREQLAVIR